MTTLFYESSAFETMESTPFAGIRMHLSVRDRVQLEASMLDMKDATKAYLKLSLDHKNNTVNFNMIKLPLKQNQSDMASYFVCRSMHILQSLIPTISKYVVIATVSCEVPKKLPNKHDFSFLKEQLNVTTSSIKDLHYAATKYLPETSCGGNKTMFLYQVQDILRLTAFMRSMGLRPTKDKLVLRCKLTDLQKKCTSFL